MQVVFRCSFSPLPPGQRAQQFFRSPLRDSAPNSSFPLPPGEGARRAGEGPGPARRDPGKTSKRKTSFTPFVASTPFVTPGPPVLVLSCGNHPQHLRHSGAAAAPSRQIPTAFAGLQTRTPPDQVRGRLPRRAARAPGMARVNRLWNNNQVKDRPRACVKMPRTRGDPGSVHTPPDGRAVGCLPAGQGRARKVYVDT